MITVHWIGIIKSGCTDNEQAADGHQEIMFWRVVDEAKDA
jgi:hypothetical protein